MKSNPTDVDRRSFLKQAASSSLGILLAKEFPLSGAVRPEIELSGAHCDAVNRRRRIVVQDDPSNFDPQHLYGTEFKRWIAHRFGYADMPGSQIDSIWWDLENGDQAVYRSRILPPFEHPGLRKWWDQGIDWIQELVQETRKRNLEVFWHHRVNSVEVRPEGGLEMERMHPVKKENPDWVIKTWWWQGMWNLAVREVREYRLSILRELAENYEFDGIQLDFARHVPFLPPGRQWELRKHVTEFVRSVRWMLLEVEKKRGRPFLLAAKVPRNLEGCRVDGFDVEEWARQNLVDILTLGSRSVDVDVEAFRRITAGRDIKLQPCFDDHHTTDGYRHPPIEFLRGVFSNWWDQGADNVVTFNWSNAPPGASKEVGARPGPISHQQAYLEAGSPESMKFKDKIFIVERRGGYPWAEGFFGRNDTAPLPILLSNQGRPAMLQVRVSENFRAQVDRVKEIVVRIVLFRTPQFRGRRAFQGAGSADAIGPPMSEQDEVEVRLNGAVLALAVRDPEWKDPHIFSPQPQPASGGRGPFLIDPNQKLLRLDYTVEARHCHAGRNRVEVRVVKRVPYRPGSDIKLEKVEMHVSYRGPMTAA